MRISSILVLVVAITLLIVAEGRTAAAPIYGGLVGWYDAGDVNGDGLPDGLANGTTVSKWVNRANPGTNDGVAAATPTLQNAPGDLVNGQPVIRFTGLFTNTAEWDSYALGGFRDSQGPVQAYVVSLSTAASTAGGDGTWERLVSSKAATDPNDYEVGGWTIMRPYSYVAPNYIKYAYPARIDSTSAAAGKSLLNVCLGRYTNSPSQHLFSGDMAEVLIFDRALNSAENILVRNYLAAKYDIAPGVDDYYAGDGSAQGNYDLDVFGIGRVNASNMVTTASSAGLTLAESGGTLGDGDWLLAGHKVPVNGWAWVNALVDNDPMLVLHSQRVWYLDKTRDLDATLTFDLAGAGLSSPGDAPLYQLLYSPTNAFAFQDLLLTPTIDGGLISFTVPNATLLDGYYSLGYVPEPSTFAMLAFGAAALAFRSRRRRR